MSLTAAAFILVYAYGLLRAFTSQAIWGLYIYLAVFYLHPPIRWWGKGLPDLRWSLFAAIITLFALMGSRVTASKVPWTAQPLVKFIVAYVVWMWLQTPWANPEHVEGLILMTKYVVLIFIIFRLVDTEQKLENFAIAHVLGCFYLGLLALTASGEGRLEMLGGPGVKDSNTLGMHVSTGILFAGSLILSLRGWKRWAVIGMVPVLANCIVQTESRGAFLGAAVGGMVYFLSAPRRYRPLIVGLGITSVFILLAYAPASYWQRMSSIDKSVESSEQRDHSAESRIVLIKAQWAMFKNHPMGLGFDTTAYLSRSYLDTEFLTAAADQDVAVYGARASHNTLMSILVDQGIPGALLAFGAIVMVFRMVFELNRNRLVTDNTKLGLMRACICGSLAAVFVSGMFTNYIKAEVQLWMLALLIVCLQIARDKAVLTLARPDDLEPRRPRSLAGHDGAAHRERY